MWVGGGTGSQLFVDGVTRVKELFKSFFTNFCCCHLRFERTCDNQSSPSYNPSPVTAHAGCTWVGRRIVDKRNLSSISGADSALGKSCLLANTNTHASAISASPSSFCSSSPAVQGGNREKTGRTKRVSWENWAAGNACAQKGVARAHLPLCAPCHWSPRRKLHAQTPGQQHMQWRRVRVNTTRHALMPLVLSM